MEQVRQVLSLEAGTLEETDAGIIWRRHIHGLSWIAHVLLRFDFPVTVRQPDKLPKVMQQLATKAFGMKATRG
jgi:hypothetical protein